MRPLIIIFAKAPDPGRVKTRLGGDPERAARLHSAFVCDALAAAGELSGQADVELSTDSATNAWAEFSVHRSLQAGGGLGDRLYAALQSGLLAGRPKTLVMGSDSPMLPSSHLRELLRSHADVAIGPTDDGGYYAIACSQAQAGMFSGVRWSTEMAMGDTIAAIEASGLRVETGPRWFDVDRPDDLDRLLQLLVQPPLSGRAAMLLNQLMTNSDAGGSGPVFLVDTENIRGVTSYLRRTNWLTDESIISVSRIGDGNMNLTARVRTDRRTFVLKQARPWVEKYPHIPAPVERASVEAAFYRVVATQIGVSEQTPRLLGFDEDSHVLLLEDLGEGACLTGLYKGATLDEPICIQLVKFLSVLHQSPVPERDRPILRNRAMRRLNHEHQYDLPLRDNNGLDLDRLTPGLASEAAKLKVDPEYCRIVTSLGQAYLADGPSLVHGDFFPGSWLRTNKGIAVIDPEFCFLGACEYDLGVLLAHLALIGALSLWQTVEGSYRGPVDWKLAKQFAGAELMRRLIGVAQLPLRADLDSKREWLRLSRSLICA